MGVVAQDVAVYGGKFTVGARRTTVDVAAIEEGAEEAAGELAVDLAGVEGAEGVEG